MRSRSLLPLPLLAAAVMLTGCVSISATSTSQPQSMGPVRLSVTACASESPGCPPSANGRSIYRFLADFDRRGETFQVQPLVAIRLPDQATPPETFTAAITDGGTLTFARSTSYENELESFEPAPAGERWWGWLSSEVAYGVRTAQSFSFTVQVPLPRPADGGALPSPLHWRPVVGGRSVDTVNGLPRTRPVDCGSTVDDVYDGFSESRSVQDSTVCVSSSSPDATRGYLDAPIVDFGLSGSTVQASPGATTTATFLAIRSGVADPATTFALRATGGPPGATIALDRATASLRDATTPVLATISVPLGAVPGSYPVTLTATAPGKPERSAVSTLVVPGTPETPRPPTQPNPPTPPVEPARDVTKPILDRASLTARRFRAGARVGPARRGRAAVGTTVRLRLSEPATVLTAVHRVDAGRRVKGRCVARARRGARCQLVPQLGSLAPQSLPAGASSFAVTGRLGRRMLAAGRYRLTLVATDAAGNRSAPTTLNVTIVRR